MRIVAADTSKPGRPASWADPTGWAWSMYASTTALRIAAFRSSTAEPGYCPPPRSDQSSSLRADTNASWGISTRPTDFIRRLPSFWRSSSLRLRVMSPP